VTDSLKYYVLL